MGAPTISIIVPVYKVENYLPACIDSILAQTFRDFELILVDDGSPDNCPAMCDEAAKKDARIRVIHQKNGGLSAARNAGLDVARGEWIGFVDSDDTVAPEMYETLYTLAQENNANLAICGFLTVDERNELLMRRNPTPQMFVLTREQTIARIAAAPFHVAWNKLYHRDIFAQLRYPVGRLNEDSFVAPAVLEQVTTAVYTQQQFYYYRQRADSIMGRAKTLKNYDAVEAAYGCWQCLLRNGQTGQPLVRGAFFVLGSLREVYCGLSRADQKADRSWEMKKLQWDVTRKTLQMAGFSAKLLAQTMFFQLWPDGYNFFHDFKSGGSGWMPERCTSMTKQPSRNMRGFLS